VSDLSDIDRLIEEGLNLYGAGDLDGALLAWEQALAADPDNAQANSYVDYVRTHYELLTNGEHRVEDGVTAPFGIEEEPEYQIEIVPGQLVVQAGGAPMYMDPLDEGWFSDETQQSPAVRPATGDEPEAPLAPPPAPSQAFEIEAEEPPSFESATREYQNLSAASGRHDTSPSPSLRPEGDFTPEATTEFQRDEHSGITFGAQVTDVRKRDLGFVQPAAVKVTVRTPTQNGGDKTPPSGIELGAASATSDDLIASLPSPRPKTETRRLPEKSRPPAVAPATDIALSQQQTRDLERQPMQQLPPAGEPGLEPLLTAPTRELGLRPGGRPSTNSEDIPTRESDVRAIRAAAAAKAAPLGEGTRHDIVLPFDPIDARSAQILDDIEADAPPNEPKEDRPRRRITALLDRALAWNSQGELDKAVAAVDLALSEDPNSALGQKLIQRNRDTIMAVFQSFLGDLDRQPQLARPLHELAAAPISPRAAFLLSRIDGTVTIDEILDVSGMPRLEAYRHLCQLFLRGILR